MHSVDRTIFLLRKYSAPEALIHLSSLGKAPEELEYQWEEPKMFYELVKSHPDNMPFERNLIPLWECNGDYIVALVDDGTSRIIKYYYEDKTDQYKLLGYSIQEVVKASIEWLYFEGEATDEEIMSVANKLDIANPMKLLNEFQNKET